jgi:hypothetical protein
MFVRYSRFETKFWHSILFLSLSVFLMSLSESPATQKFQLSRYLWTRENYFFFSRYKRRRRGFWVGEEEFQVNYSIRIAGKEGRVRVGVY